MLKVIIAKNAVITPSGWKPKYFTLVLSTK